MVENEVDDMSLKEKYERRYKISDKGDKFGRVCLSGLEIISSSSSCSFDQRHLQIFQLHHLGPDEMPFLIMEKLLHLPIAPS
jgi:hypothetical protein